MKWRVQRHPFPSLGVEFPLLVCVVQQPRRSASEKTRTRTRKRHLRHTGRGPRREEVEKEAERLTLAEAGDRMTDVDADAVDEDEGAAGRKPGGNG